MIFDIFRWIFSAIDANISDSKDEFKEAVLHLGLDAEIGQNELVPVYGLINDNSDDLSRIIDGQQVYVYEDIEMSFTRFAMPSKTTSKILMKRDGDIISGSIPYNLTVSYLYSIYNSI